MTELKDQLTLSGYIEGINKERDVKGDGSTSAGTALYEQTRPAKKEPRGWRHPYTIKRGTANWSGPYGKDGTQRLENVPQDVIATPFSRQRYDGIWTYRFEVDSPPELQGKHFVVAQVPKGKGWIR